ncbi:probable UDP-sugar transporter protein SLC35A5 isoform X2 [Oenanthe melanoleuca]|uniref:probable UDP-sugar transporter protein SLC35A5 isoform X2 n=1 Tax=Oenanthe melanoleuca TaxID=2939378 RepID=UPI0024C1F8FF|nr:probable UDP-sugar transporter protein SLC35A5 isoform X2 [Oenanthe melanoleuca]XP_056356180.1 probable UDP-sugar transporter protein SLC35A5 isoform X2 [Oenanthe melanoleuca]XP_056356190.1 probable UDP-sugar transporter protein SLC35A5 isoform X2 [Oenanthe melanoleuca]
MKLECSSRFAFCSKTTSQTLLLAGVFITLGSSRILLMKYSANEDNKYDYLPATVNMCSEVVKLVLCVVLALWKRKKEKGCMDNLSECFSWKNVCNSMKWSIPAFLYFLDNLIVFYVLSYLQPAMAVLFSNFVIITTALLFRIVLKPSNHCLLATGPEETCVEKGNCAAPSFLRGFQWNVTSTMAGALKPLRLSLGHLLILVQCFVSALANIYNEKMLKDVDQLGESIFTQNSKLYAFGVLFNGLMLALQAKDRRQIGNCGFFYGHNTFSVALIFVTAFLGLAVAFILKFRDNMFHVMTAQINTVIITAVSFIIFDFRPSVEFFLEAPVVLLSIFIYNACKARGLEYATLRERGKLIKGDAWERSSGDGEEFERLNKPSSDIDTDEDSL